MTATEIQDRKLAAALKRGELMAAIAELGELAREMKAMEDVGLLAAYRVACREAEILQAKVKNLGTELDELRTLG